ncbi:MAG: hypothetical protein K0R69_1470 [Clostridia bacterium]|nr:hypothetical protein [Clostridia bacterium]
MEAEVSMNINMISMDMKELMVRNHITYISGTMQSEEKHGRFSL